MLQSADPQAVPVQAAPARRAALMHWLIFTGLTLFGAALLWRFGLIARMAGADRTYISFVIVVLYVATCVHCLWRTLAVAREDDAVRQAARIIMGRGELVDVAELLERRGPGRLPDSLVVGHMRDLERKAGAQEARPLDQGMLLRGLAARLRGSNPFGSFASDTLMKLGLVGTIVGFIIMLSPIAGLDPNDRAAIKSSMGLMSEGMAVAMYTTLAGLIGSILVKIQYYMLDEATSRVFASSVRLLELHVVPDLERRSNRARHPPGMIDDFDFSPREEPFDPFSVMLFKAMQVLAFLFFLALLSVSPDAHEGKVDLKADFLITMSWPDSHPDDMDLFVQDPLGSMVWYRRRTADFMTLDRDDRGGVSDFIMVGDRKVLSPIRQETVSIRGIIAGEYTVNVYHFAALTGKAVPVSVRVEKLNPTVQVVHYDTITVDHGGDEKTAVRFTIDEAGAVTDVNLTPKSLTRLLHDPRDTPMSPRR